jgi:hypothetical protein
MGDTEEVCGPLRQGTGADHINLIDRGVREFCSEL